MQPKPTSSLLHFTDVVRINNSKEGIQTAAIERDVGLLLTIFLEQETHDFNSFLRVWRKLNFAHIHYACLDAESRPGFMQAIYDHILDHFRSNIKAKKIGTIYALYLMYKTQPTGWPLASIRVTQEMFAALCEYDTKCFESKHTELVKVSIIFNGLRTEGAFTIVARTTLLPSNYKEVEELADKSRLLEGIRGIKRKRMECDALQAALMGEERNGFKRMIYNYQSLKNKVCNTPNAKALARRMFERKTTVKTNDPKDLEFTLNNSLLSVKESDFVTTLKEAKEALLNSRLRNLQAHNLSSNTSKSVPGNNTSR